jgi:hypothetical protein
MRTWLTLASPLAALALGVAAAARPAAAQRAVAENARPAAVPTTTVALRPVAAYRFAASPRTTGLPDEVTLADSNGVLVASFRVAGARESRPMLVDVLDTDLVLQGETPTGVLTLRLYGQNEVASTGVFEGRWWLGERAGDLRGRITR